MASPILKSAPLRQRIREALFEVRCSRHHLDCRCGLYKGHWCSLQEYTAQQSLDKLLDRLQP